MKAGGAAAENQEKHRRVSKFEPSSLPALLLAQAVKGTGWWWKVVESLPRPCVLLSMGFGASEHILAGLGSSPGVVSTVLLLTLPQLPEHVGHTSEPGEA